MLRKLLFLFLGPLLFSSCVETSINKTESPGEAIETAGDLICQNGYKNEGNSCVNQQELPTVVVTGSESDWHSHIGSDDDREFVYSELAGFEDPSAIYTIKYAAPPGTGSGWKRN